MGKVLNGTLTIHSSTLA